MKISDKEKIKILELHYNSKMKPWLFEQPSASNVWNNPDKFLPNKSTQSTSGYDPNKLNFVEYQKSLEAMKRIQNLPKPKDFEAPDYKNPPTAKALYGPMPKTEISLEQKKKIVLGIHEFLDLVSFIAGWIPLPVAQIISRGADLANAGVYYFEGKPKEAGLYIVLMATSWGADRLATGIIGQMERTALENTSKTLAKKIEQNAIETITKNEFNILENIFKNQEQLTKEWTAFAKEEAEKLLKNPNNYNLGFIMNKLSKETTWEYVKKIALNPTVLRQMFIRGFGDAYTNLEAGYQYEQYNDFYVFLENRGYNVELVMGEFGGDINNQEDKNKLEKAWNDSRIKSYDDKAYNSYDDMKSQNFAKNKMVKGWRPLYQMEGFLPCDLIPSKMEENLLKVETNEYKNPCVERITNEQLLKNNIRLPFDYKKVGNNYYYSEIGKNNWNKLTNSENIKFLKTQIFPLFSKK